MRKITVSKADFKSIRSSNKLYMDKSLLIKDILDNDDEGIYLFTRPRRFGKSLNLSMLDAFFNMKYKGNTWFDGLKISDCPEYGRYKNSYPVVHLDFKKLSSGSYGSFLATYSRILSESIDGFNQLNDSASLNPYLKKDLETIRNTDGTLPWMTDALNTLVRALRIHFDSKIVILIDEYDHPANSSYGSDCSEKIRSFLGTALSSVLKDNEDVQMAVLTGIMQITKESIFSGLNNLVVNNVFSTISSDRFGFTNEEVQTICTEQGRPERYSEAKEWYDGYVFGNSDVYNPWSVLQYANKGFVPGTYWAGTSGNDILDTLLDHMDPLIFSDLSSLRRNEPIHAPLDTSISFDYLDNSTYSLYSVMVMSGYLKAERYGNEFTLTVPNKEMHHVFTEKILDRIQISHSTMGSFLKAILTGNVQEMTSILEKIMYGSVSCRILDNEHVYQALLLGMLSVSEDGYHITGDFESGDGYHDILIEDRLGRRPHAVIEIKKTDDQDSVKPLADKALKQIHGKGYKGLKEEVYLYGVVFHRKNPYIVMESMTV